MFIDKFQYDADKITETMKEMLWIIDELLLCEMPEIESQTTTQ